MATTVKYTIVVAACLLGALGAVGCVIAAMFEIDGFGRREGGPSALYLASLLLGFAASVVVPLALWRILLPESAPPPLVGAAVLAAGIVLVVLFLGIR